MVTNGYKIVFVHKTNKKIYAKETTSPAAVQGGVPLGTNVSESAKGPLQLGGSSVSLLNQKPSLQNYTEIQNKTNTKMLNTDPTKPFGIRTT